MLNVKKNDLAKTMFQVAQEYFSFGKKSVEIGIFKDSISGNYEVDRTFGISDDRIIFAEIFNIQFLVDLDDLQFKINGILEKEEVST